WSEMRRLGRRGGRAWGGFDLLRNRPLRCECHDGHNGRGCEVSNAHPFPPLRLSMTQGMSPEHGDIIAELRLAAVPEPGPALLLACMLPDQAGSGQPATAAAELIARPLGDNRTFPGPSTGVPSSCVSTQGLGPRPVCAVSGSNGGPSR